MLEAAYDLSHSAVLSLSITPVWQGEQGTAAVHADNPEAASVGQEDVGGPSGALPGEAAQGASNRAEAQPAPAPAPPGQSDTSAWRRFVDERMGECTLMPGRHVDGVEGCGLLVDAANSFAEKQCCTCVRHSIALYG